ncbi:MAG: hypothetical protein AAF747_08300, partial [Planctomycetota bacterium]
SLRLDATNRDAASLIWSDFGMDDPDPVRRMEFLTYLLYADPMRPATHLAIAEELIIAGSPLDASRFFNLGWILTPLREGTRSQSLIERALVIEWYQNGPEAVLEQMQSQLDGQRARAVALREQAQENLENLDLYPKPDEVLLDPGYERVRLGAAIISGDIETVIASGSDLFKGIRLFSEQMEDQRNWPPGATAEQMDYLVAERAAQTLAFQAWGSTSPDILRQQLPVVEPVLGPDYPAIVAMKAQIASGEGRFDEALEMFDSVRDTQLIADIGAATALRGLGRVDDARARLADLARRAPLTAEGVYARTLMINETGEDPLRAATNAEVVALSRRIPFWLDKMATEPSSHQAFEADVVEPSLGPLGRAKLKLRLTNNAPVPLALGDSMPLESTLLAVPRVRIGARTDLDLPRPAPIRLDRRLRLTPGESIEIVVDAAPGVTGMTLRTGIGRSVRANWSIFQGFAVTSAGRLQQHPLGLKSVTTTAIWEQLPLASAPPADLATALRERPAADFPIVTAAVRARIIEASRSNERLTLAEVEEIARAAADRYPTLGLEERAMLAAVLPHAGMAPGMEPLDDVIRAETDPKLAPLVLLTRVRSADDDLLSRWSEADDAELDVIVGVMQSRWSLENPTGYATVDSTFRGLVRPPLLLGADGSVR